MPIGILVIVVDASGDVMLVFELYPWRWSLGLLRSQSGETVRSVPLSTFVRTKGQGNSFPVFRIAVSPASKYFMLPL